MFGLAAAALLLVAAGGQLFRCCAPAPRRAGAPARPAASGPATQPLGMPDLSGTGTPDEPDADRIDPAPSAEPAAGSTVDRWRAGRPRR